MTTRDETSIINIPDRYIQDESEKILKKAAAKESRLSDLGKELLTLRTTGFYNYINKIQPSDMLFYLVLIMSMVLLSDYIPWMLKDVMGLGMGLVLVYYLHEGKRATHVDRLKTTEIHMEQIIPKPKYFHQDANFIEFAYNMLSYRIYNKEAFTKMIQSIDHFLEIWIDIENPALQNCAETYEIAVDMKNTALNELQSLIHSIPLDDKLILSTKLMNAIKTLQLYLQRHLDEMAEICNARTEAKGWNMFTKKIDKYAIPGQDKLKDPRYHLF
jgi:hypothetical protein